jgi:hypothetical protein
MHEKSITIQKRDGSWVNIKGIVNGRFAPRQAEKMFRSGNRKALGGASFPSVGAATKAAKARSRKFDR